MSHTHISANRRAKMEIVDGLKVTFDKAMSYVMLGFKGLTVFQVTELRSAFRKAGVEYRVIKNSLIHQAMKDSGLADDPSVGTALVGETGVAFSFEDPSIAAKVVRDFRKKDEKNEKLQVKLAVVDASVIPGDRVESDLASMPGKDELRAMLLATLQAPAQNLVAQLQAPAQNLVYVLEARRKQLGGEDAA